MRSWRKGAEAKVSAALELNIVKERVYGVEELSIVQYPRRRAMV